MLASITPLGERARQSTWSVTVTAFLGGASAAGAAAGVVLGGAGALVMPASLGSRARLATVAVAVLGALALDARGRGSPGPRRQVDERWLDGYRGWVYGLGYGAQLGLGVTTIVSSAATYVALLAAFLTGDPVRGAIVAGSFGAVRGLTPLLGAGVRSPDQLLALHARLVRAREPVRRGGIALLGAMLAVALALAGDLS